MAPTTPAHPASDQVAVGDAVDVPGGMHGTVRFVGAVQGKKGTFAGVELHSEFLARGKNDGDVDGVSYFTTNPGAGIFVPMGKIARRTPSNGSTATTLPITPASGAPVAVKNANRSTTITPPTPALPKFSASIGPGTRAPSPQVKRPRASLSRPDSPLRRKQAAPAPRPSLEAPTKVPARFGSPPNRLTQSVRGTAGDPVKKTSRFDGKSSVGPRSASAMGSAPDHDDEPTHTGFHRAKTNGSVGSVSSFGMKLHRPASRAQAVNDDDIDRLHSQLDDRDRQLKDQAATLAEMESSLSELKSFIEHSDGPRLRRNSLDDKDSAQLRLMLREKNDKIAMLTAEFDARRADFRSTIDTLELASTETERVYEKRMEELMIELREAESRNLDVDSVASQLKQLEELVQELEEGLEDARRGEAEARGEAEFLRGEVDRTRSELRREREKNGSGPNAYGDSVTSSKELEQKEDEIRGLKAIIHSLSRDPISRADGGTAAPRPASLDGSPGDACEGKTARDNLERQVAELQAMLDRKSVKEDELQQELEALRANTVPGQRSTQRDSRDTIIPVRTHGSRTPDATRRGQALDRMHESDNYSTATETSTLWCEICETSGHDILTCTNMFGSEGGKNVRETKTGGAKDAGREPSTTRTTLNADVAQPAPLSREI